MHKTFPSVVGKILTSSSALSPLCRWTPAKPIESKVSVLCHCVLVHCICAYTKEKRHYKKTCNLCKCEDKAAKSCFARDPDPPVNAHVHKTLHTYILLSTHIQFTIYCKARHRCPVLVSYVWNKPMLTWKMLRTATKTYRKNRLLSP